MKSLALLLTLLLPLLTFPALNSQTGGGDEAIDLKDLSQYVRVTDQPFEMHDTAALLCKVATDQKDNLHEPKYPAEAFCHVYVSPAAKETILSGQGTYPEGSLVIKAKLTSRDDETPEFYTVMQKMPAGYDAEHGDWKYLIIDGSTFRQLASGRIDSCKSCHDQYSQTDYVTRIYLNQKKSSN